MTFGFIFTRHVRDEVTNHYWNTNITQLRKHYANAKIIIIDDNSNYNFVKSFDEYPNVEIIQSEYNGRGELLPFIYFLRHKWFDNAVIIHDSLFIHKRIHFEKIKLPVLPLWHHNYDAENLDNLVRISNHLQNNTKIKNILTNNVSKVLINSFNFRKNEDKYTLCFGVQCFIKYDFLYMLEQKYKISNLIYAIHNRTDRCGLERIMGILFCEECKEIRQKPNSLFGDILTYPKAFQYKYNHYINDYKHNRINKVVVKVWSGR
jgi:hypothetical protein